MTQNSISQNPLKSEVGSSCEGLRLIVFLGFRDSEAVASKRKLDIPTVAPSRHKISEAGIRHTNRQPETLNRNPPFVRFIFFQSLSAILFKLLKSPSLHDLLAASSSDEFRVLACRNPTPET